jgi:serine/threonine protein kinase
VTYNVIATSYFERIEAARTPGDLFPEADAARSTYRRLARLVHPDVNPDHKTRAEAAFARLSELWSAFNNGGDPKPKPQDPTYVTKRHTFFVKNLIDRGDIANVYAVVWHDDPASSILNNAALKMPRSPKNSDLIANEITALKKLKEGVDEDFRMYHPTTVDSFRHRDSESKDRRVVVTEFLDGFVSLRDVMRAYPTGIDGRDMAWMARRLWVAMDTAHEAGLSHNAVFPENVMIHPTMHGVVLIDWCYSAPMGEKVSAVVQRYKDYEWYGTQYAKPLDHRLDVRQASFTLEALLGPRHLHEARPFRAFFKGCRVASAPPAGQLFEEFDELLARLYGRRRYRPFKMPDTWRKEP